jgi:hypothetical protein
MRWYLLCALFFFFWLWVLDPTVFDQKSKVNSSYDSKIPKQMQALSWGSDRDVFWFRTDMADVKQNAILGSLSHVLVEYLAENIYVYKILFQGSALEERARLAACMGGSLFLDDAGKLQFLWLTDKAGHKRLLSTFSKEQMAKLTSGSALHLSWAVNRHLYFKLINDLIVISSQDKRWPSKQFLNSGPNQQLFFKLSSDIASLKEIGELAGYLKKYCPNGVGGYLNKSSICFKDLKVESIKQKFLSLDAFKRNQIMIGLKRDRIEVENLSFLSKWTGLRGQLGELLSLWSGGVSMVADMTPSKTWDWNISMDFSSKGASAQSIAKMSDFFQKNGGMFNEVDKGRYSILIPMVSSPVYMHRTSADLIFGNRLGSGNSSMQLKDNSVFAASLLVGALRTELQELIAQGAQRYHFRYIRACQNSLKNHEAMSPSCPLGVSYKRTKDGWRCDLHDKGVSSLVAEDSRFLDFQNLVQVLNQLMLVVFKEGEKIELEIRYN